MREGEEMKLSTRRYKDWLVNTKLAYSCWPSGASNKTIFKWIDKAFKAGYEKGCDDAYQEQQKKIDAVLEHINKKCDEFCETHDMDSVALLEEIEELLK